MEGNEMTHGQKVYLHYKKYRIVAVHGSDIYTIRNKAGEQKIVNGSYLFSFKQLRTKFDNFIIWFVELPTIKAAFYIAMFLLMSAFLFVLFFAYL